MAKPTIAALRKAVEKAGGVLESDGCGGFDVLADRSAKRKWKYTETWCQPLSLGEFDSEEERDAEIQRAIDIATSGTEPFGDT